MRKSLAFLFYGNMCEVGKYILKQNLSSSKLDSEIEIMVKYKKELISRPEQIHNFDFEFEI